MSKASFAAARQHEQDITPLYETGKAGVSAEAILRADFGEFPLKGLNIVVTPKTLIRVASYKEVSPYEIYLKKQKEILSD